jgi:enolase-phosphatase E1
VTRPDPRVPAAVLLDIEGTTTPIAFVYDVLFPFARTHLREYVEDPENAAEVDAISDALKAAGEWRGAVRASAEWLMDRDVKSPALKQLQGRIWERGYRAGALSGQLYPDVAPAIRRWRGRGVDVAIYSSGSALAQRLLFGSTSDGDLTPLLSGFFDTSVGAKISADSYRRIAGELGHAPGGVLFVSDVTTELRAAREAGLQVVLSIRPGNSPQADAQDFESIRSFDEIRPPG